MRSPHSGLAIGAAIAALALVSGCSNAKAQTLLPDASPLSIPQAPARVVVPPAPEPPPAVIETTAPATSPASANPPTNGNRPNRDPRPPAPPSNPPAATPPAPAAPTAPTTPLETQGNQGELEQRARDLIGSAEGTLKKINYAALSSDGKSQADTAQRFITQAKAALVAKNVVYAWQLADKANTIATLLLRHS